MGREATTDEKLKERLTGAAVVVVLVVIFVPAIFRGAPPPAVHEPALILPATALPTAAPTAAPTLVAEPQPASASVPVAPAAPMSVPLPEPRPEPRAEPRPELKPQQQAASAVTESPAATARTGWVVQLGSFKSPSNAQRLVRAVAAKGIKATVAGPDDRGFYRVRTPIAADRNEAVALRERLRLAGVAGMISSAP